MFDTHCHIYKTETKNYKDIIKKCLNKNINLIINSVNIKTSKEVIKLSKKYNNVYASIGLNYDEVENINKKDFIKLERLINKNNIIAIGEIGLDYYWTKDNKDKQKYIFEKQLKLAEEYNLPVIIHARNSIQDVYDILNISFVFLVVSSITFSGVSFFISAILLIIYIKFVGLFFFPLLGSGVK